MAFGLTTSPSWYHQALVLVLVVGIFHTFVDARPQNTETPSEDNPGEDWQEAVNWMVPNDDTVPSDSWRAFAPSKIRSTIRWWEETMDDNLWDSDLYGDPDFEEEENAEDAMEDSSEVNKENSEDRSSEVGSEEGENTDSLTDTESNDNNSDEDLSASDESSDESISEEPKESESNENDDIQSDYVPKGDVNSFLDQGSMSPYFGDDLSKKTWNPNYEVDNSVVDTNDETASDKTVRDPKENSRHGALMEDVVEGGSPSATTQEGDVKDDIQILDELKSMDDTATTDKDKSEEENEESRSVDDDKTEDEEEKSGLQSEVEVLDSRVDEDVQRPVKTSVIEDVDEPADDDSASDNDDELRESINIIPTKSKRIESDNPSTTKDKDNYASEVAKKFASLNLKTEEESTQDKLDDSENNLQDWDQHDVKKKEKKTDGAFEDWADWDDSAFDDYDKDDSEDDSLETKDFVDDNGEKSDLKSKKDDASDNDDEDIWSYYDDKDDDKSSDESDYEDDVDESEDDDDNEDSEESDESDDDDDYDDAEDDDEEDSDESEEDDDEDEDNEAEDYYYEDEDVNDTGKSAKLSMKSKQVKEQSDDSSSAQKTVKDLEIDSLSVQPVDSAVAVDENHYSKGIIYDSSHPFKKAKPSVKKDLDGPKSATHQSGDESSENEDDVKTEMNEEPPRTTADLEENGHSEEKMSTGLESLTSPNPAPTVTTWTDTSQPNLSPSPSSSPWPSTDDLMFGDQPMGVDDDEEEGYVDSYPREKCHIDYDCRSGRTCVDRVCKCLRASDCAGHYKPVCGSDGVQYPSHCELHRTSCLIHKRIRIDWSGRCFKQQSLKKERSWLVEQEHLLQKEKEKLKSQQGDNFEQIPSDKIEEYTKPFRLGQESLDKQDDVEKKAKVSIKGDEKKRENCTWNEMARFKEDLLMYHCHKFVEPNCKLEVKTDRQYLSMLMFSYYDRNFDFFLTPEELEDKERSEHFNNKIIRNCHLRDFVKFADVDQYDGKLTVSEFTQSFEISKPNNPVQSNLEIVSTLASAGDGLELKCGVKASSVVWKRYGVKLEDDKKNHKLMVFDDGALFFSKLNLHHIGNYTCMDTMDEKNAQVHRLSIQTSPIIEVYPASQTDTVGSDVELRCHAEGVPKPTISWKHNGKDVLNTKHISVYYGHEHIVIHDAQAERDSGSYICSAHSQAGTNAKSVTVNIVPPVPYTSNDKARNEGTFLVFHEQGITAYDPLHCLPRHEVKGDFGKFKFIPDAIDSPLRLCKEGKSCEWKDVVKVGSDFVYVSQPDQNRVLVVEAGHYWNPLQVIDTDHQPEKLQYVPHLDQVWVLCRSQKNSNSDKTIVVIRDASQLIQHRSVHTRPVGNHFDTVQDLFIAPQNDLHHEFDHGYVTHAGKASLSKIDLEDMSYTEAIDLSMYGCMPVHIAFVPLGGHVVIQCVSKTDQHTLQLVMDYLTNAIVSTTSIPGRPLVSPDSRHLITVDEFTGKVVVASVSAEGLMETTYEVTVSASISDVSFMHSSYHHGYDLILTSADDDDLIVMNLVTGKVEKMPGSSQTESSQTWKPSPVHRTIVTGDAMSRFVMSPSKSSLAVINFKFKRVECEFTELTGDKVMVHISPASTES